eukprot:5809532-Pyramimonas_sp.AAC.1
MQGWGPRASSSDHPMCSQVCPHPQQFPGWETVARAAPALLVVGVAGWLNQLCITMGLARAPAAKATAMGYLQ